MVLGTTPFRCFSIEVTPIFHLRYIPNLEICFLLLKPPASTEAILFLRNTVSILRKIFQNLPNGTILFGGIATPKRPSKSFYGLNKCSFNVSCSQQGRTYGVVGVTPLSQKFCRQISQVFNFCRKICTILLPRNSDTKQLLH